MHNTTEVKFGPLLAAGTLIGLGLGGFLNSIIFHQILQIHNLLSAKIAPDSLEGLRLNIFWDGIFLSITWLIAFLGIIFLWQACLNPYTPKSSKAFTGSLFMGIGLFITIEGFVNHLLLEAHHVTELGSEDKKLFWDLVLITFGLLTSIFGRVLITQGKRSFYNTQILNARNAKIHFKPAFLYQNHPLPKRVNIHR